jgi:nucleotide-binding universal stress UspA family protein
MVSIKKILFPIDFSESMDEFIPYAVTLAQKFEASLYLVTVTPDISSFASFYAPHTNIQGFQDEVQQGAEAKIKALAGRLQDLPHVETYILKGGAADKIIDLARQEGIDLIVMGTHGRTGLEKTIFGSVCDKVIKSGTCPVLSIPPRG